MAVWNRHVAGRTCTCLLAALWLLPPRSTTWSAAFTNASVAPARPLLQRRASDLEERRAKCPLSQEQLESDHGDKWEDVRDILVGLRASSPEAIMRVPLEITQNLVPYCPFHVCHGFRGGSRRKPVCQFCAWEARFTALRFQDPQFLAATEKDDNQSIRDRAKQWSLLLGLEEMGMFLGSVIAFPYAQQQCSL